MKTTISRFLASLLVVSFSLTPIWATCGGGGGGGTGGVGGGNSAGPAPTVYNVPWNIWAAGKVPTKGLVLYWFPATNDEVKKSPLRTSRILSLLSAQCVSMQIADYRATEFQKLVGDSKPPVTVLATFDGTPIQKVENVGGKLKIDVVEKTVQGEMKQRESALDQSIKTAREKIKTGDNAGAVALLKPVAEEKCLFP